MYKICISNKFEKDFERCFRRKFDLELFGKVLELLESSGKLPKKHKSHLLSGVYKGYWECHIKPDWLLIWKLAEAAKVITFVRTGTHSDLFR